MTLVYVLSICYSALLQVQTVPIEDLLQIFKLLGMVHFKVIASMISIVNAYLLLILHAFIASLRIE